MLLFVALLLASRLSGTQASYYTFPDCTSSPLKANGVCDMNLSTLERAKSLVSAFTLEEKFSNLIDIAPGSERLGLPYYEWWNEALHGVAHSRGIHYTTSGEWSYATSFAEPILLGAAFDDDMVLEVASLISDEARAFGNNGISGLDFWSPNINPFKDPRWGRGQETPGEDPYHIQRYVRSYVTGMQGNNTNKKKVTACCKHFAAYDMEDYNGLTRFDFDAYVTSQDLAEYYLPPFRSCTRDAKAGSVMCALNNVNGEPACGSSYLMQTILRDHWNWKGDDNWIVSDCGAIGSFYLERGMGTSAAGTAITAALSLKAGTDLNCGYIYNASLPVAYDQGLISEDDLDRALIRLYSSLVNLGYFDPVSKRQYSNLGWNNVATNRSIQVARETASKGMVLLKNDGLLPITEVAGKKLALIGAIANDTIPYLNTLGGYSGPTKFLHPALYGAQQLAWKVSFTNGTAVNTNSTSGFAKALSIAQDADYVIYVGGLDNTIEAESFDRTSISWPGNQLDLINQLATLGKPMTVIQMGGGQVDDSAILANKNISALLWGGYAGQDSGPALFDVITGVVAPAGRLPVTQYPAKYAEQVPMTDMSLRPSAPNPGRTYRWYKDSVIEFGYGLHYTNFEAKFTTKSGNTYNINSLVSKAKHLDEPIDLAPFDTFKASVTNVGNTTSDYVALLFAVTTDAGPSPYPRKTLVSYTRAAGIKPKETRAIQLDVNLGSIARTNNRGDLVLYPGSFTLEIDVEGVLPVQPQLQFKITGTNYTLDNFPQPS
jgi:beta-D-xylosidase 4